MEKPYRMLRLLQGDVGSGKTLVALLATLKAVNDGKQAAFMVPTEILAQQHFESFNNLINTNTHKIDILTGKTNTKQKKEIYESIWYKRT